MPLEIDDCFAVDVPSAPEYDRLAEAIRPHTHDDRAVSTTDDGLALTHTYAGERGSPQAFQAAFDFLQRNANGRYSDRTLMAISRWSFVSAELVEGTRQLDGPAPAVVSLSREVTYDEETEVKTGGTAALAVTLPSGEGSKLIIATAPEARRNGYGSLLVRELRYFPFIHAWVGATNTVGQQFLLANAMHPLAMNRRQAVMYGYDEMPDEDGVAR